MRAPRTLHNLPAILKSPEKPAVVAEGEKCADAAATVFQDHLATTWAGGADAWSRTDWQPLSGRDVLLLADANEVGRRAMRDIAPCASHPADAPCGSTCRLATMGETSPTGSMRTA